jgi:hypothetical protein
MGYDICAGTVLEEKEKILSQIAAEGSIVVFEHDPDTVAATIMKNEKGHYCIKEKISF